MTFMGRRFVYPVPRAIKGDQNSKYKQEPQIEPSESDNETHTGHGGDSHSMRYPKRRRTSPQYLSDYECKVECDDQILANADCCYV